ncbi:hypothetical protein [Streptomyces sp. NPDC017260]|uniref:hypothetical protein n=1 Tax=unclassified Streptomyces TaxID=2593676 RepID=UPI003798FC4C
MTEMPDHVSVKPLAELLGSLTQNLYLSTACAAGQHDDCVPVDPYRGLPCCCPLCDHVDLDGAPPPAEMPLHHLAEEGREKDGYTYQGQFLGVRLDLYERIEQILADHVHELRRPPLTYEVAVAVALFLAPRSGA